MNAPLYNQQILRLATRIPHHARLANPDATTEKRSPICGSRVTVDVILDRENTISELGLEVRACALGQAAAALMAEHAIGASAVLLADTRDALSAFLAGERDNPGTWPGLDLFEPARPHLARHASILLAFEAAAEAVANASVKG
jgi:NifU-like protein involved in Fe-S cluster formation